MLSQNELLHEFQTSEDLEHLKKLVDENRATLNPDVCGDIFLALALARADKPSVSKCSILLDLFDVEHTFENGAALIDYDERFSDEIVALLVAKGANVSGPNLFGRTPLYRACRDGKIERVRMYLDAGAVLVQTQYEATGRYKGNNGGVTGAHSVLKEAYQKRNKALCALLIERGADINESIFNSFDSFLCEACRNTDIGAVNFLLSLGANVNARNAWGHAPLDYAIDNQALTLLLLDAGAEVNSKGVEGRTVLHRASHLGLKDIVALLLKKGAAVDATDENEETPLHRACTSKGSTASEQARKEVAALLIAHDADIHALNRHRREPLDLALEHKQAAIAEVLNNSRHLAML